MENSKKSSNNDKEGDGLATELNHESLVQIKVGNGKDAYES